MIIFDSQSKCVYAALGFSDSVCDVREVADQVQIVFKDKRAHPIDPPVRIAIAPNTVEACDKLIEIFKIARARLWDQEIERRRAARSIDGL